MSMFKTTPSTAADARDINAVLDRFERQTAGLLASAGDPTIADCDPHLPAWYAHKIAFCCRAVRRCIAANNASEAAYNTVMLMQWAEHANIDEWEDQIKHGARNLKKLQDARDARRKKVSDADAPAIKRKIDRLSDKRLSDVVQWAGTPQLSKIDLTEEETQ